MMNLLFAEKFQEPIQLANAHPFEQIHMSREGWIGLARKRGRDDFLNASLSR